MKINIMKPMILLSFIFLLSLSAHAQDDDTVQYIHGLPQTGEDSVQPAPQDDVAPADSIIQLSVEQLPRELVKTLNDNPLYRGWEKHTVQIDKNTGLYWLHIRERKSIRSYGFNKDGHAVSMNEKDTPE